MEEHTVMTVCNVPTRGTDGKEIENACARVCLKLLTNRTTERQTTKEQLSLVSDQNCKCMCSIKSGDKLTESFVRSTPIAFWDRAVKDVVLKYIREVMNLDMSRVFKLLK